MNFSLFFFSIQIVHWGIWFCFWFVIIQTGDWTVHAMCISDSLLPLWDHPLLLHYDVWVKWIGAHARTGGEGENIAKRCKRKLERCWALCPAWSEVNNTGNILNLTQIIEIKPWKTVKFLPGLTFWMNAPSQSVQTSIHKWPDIKPLSFLPLCKGYENSIPLIPATESRVTLL